MFEKVKAFFRQEPVVVLTTLAGLVGASVTEITDQLQPGDGWYAIGLAVLAVVVRHFVSPAKEA